MSEERKMILQMVADGKISADEADKLLQAIDDSERAAQSAAADHVRGSQKTGVFSDLGHSIEQAVREGLRGLDESLQHLEKDFEIRLKHEKLHEKIEEKIRKAAERAAERAARAEERAARHAERAAERAAEQAERMAFRMRREFHSEHINHTGHPARKTFVKVGVAIDRETLSDTQTLSLSAQPGDRLVVENRVGDTTVEFHSGDQIEVECRKTVWGENKEDARARADATVVELVRDGSDVGVAVNRPAISGVGIIHLKDTRLDYVIRVPQGTHLDIRTKVGDLKVSGAEQLGTWHLATQVGDVDIRVAPGAGFRYDLHTRLGMLRLDLPEIQNSNPDGGSWSLNGFVGDGAGSLTVYVKTGNLIVRA